MSRLDFSFSGSFILVAFRVALGCALFVPFILLVRGKAPRVSGAGTITTHTPCTHGGYTKSGIAIAANAATTGIVAPALVGGAVVGGAASTTHELPLSVYPASHVQSASASEPAGEFEFSGQDDGTSTDMASTEVPPAKYFPAGTCVMVPAEAPPAPALLR